VIVEIWRTSGICYGASGFWKASGFSFVVSGCRLGVLQNPVQGGGGDHLDGRHAATTIRRLRIFRYFFIVIVYRSTVTGGVFLLMSTNHYRISLGTRTCRASTIKPLCRRYYDRGEAREASRALWKAQGPFQHEGRLGWRSVHVRRPYRDPGPPFKLRSRHISKRSFGASGWRGLQEGSCPWRAV
jgi:hypothetical protein